jgi:hypothetical protein
MCFSKRASERRDLEGEFAKLGFIYAEVLQPVTECSGDGEQAAAMD